MANNQNEEAKVVSLLNLPNPVTTGIDGSDTFPTTYNEYMQAVETIASQNIRALVSANKLEDAFFEYDVPTGKVIEEAVIAMAEASDFSRAPAFVVADPKVYVKYFNNFEEKQFNVSVRRDDIRAVIAKGNSPEQVAGAIMESQTQGEGSYDYKQARNLIEKATFVDYSTILGSSTAKKVPATMKGVVWAIRDMYNALKAENDNLAGVSGLKQSTPTEDIRIAIPTKVLNLIDVVELANIFNLTKEEMFGKIVEINVEDEADKTNWYKVCVYDRKALGRATRTFDYTQDIYGNARVSTHYLTTSRAYFHNGLYKGVRLDCTKACEAATDTLLAAAA